jgi:hypothetical protein
MTPASPLQSSREPTALKRRQAHERPTIEDLDEQFRMTKWVVILSMIATGLIVAYGIHSILVWLNRWLAYAKGNSDFVFLPQPAIWWFLPGLAALCFSWEITLQVWSLFSSRKKVSLFSDWSNETKTMWGGGGRYAGLDSRWALRRLSLVIVLPIAVLTVLALPMHSELRQEGLVECGYAFRACQVFPYSEVQSLRMVKGFFNGKGRFVARAGIVMKFRDRHSWSSADWDVDRKIVDPVLEHFLESKTGLRLGASETGTDRPRIP